MSEVKKGAKPYAQYSKNNKGKGTKNPKSAKPYAEYSRNVNERRNPVPIIIGATVIVVAIIGVVAFLLTRSDDKSDTAGAAARNATQETASVTVSGEDLPPAPSAEGATLVPPADDPAVGRTIPKLAGQSFDESPLTIDPADGKAKVIVFLAHWCPHCQAEVPLIQEYLDSGDAPSDVEFYSVATQTDSDQANYPPSGWLAREGWQPPVLLDDEAGTAAKAYGAPGWPYMVFVGADGKVVQRGSGEVPIEQFAAAVAQLSGSGAAATTAPATSAPAA